MALSRTLSQSMPRVHPLFSLITLRRRSTKANPQLIEVDLDSTDSTEVVGVGITKLEDAIHSLNVRRAAPDWLPFLPGYSYWVPPPQHSQSTREAHAQAASVVELVRKLASASASSSSSSSSNPRVLSRDYMASDDEQQLATFSSRGWPLSEDASPLHTNVTVLEVELHHIQDSEDSEDGSHDEED